MAESPTIRVCPLSLRADAIKLVLKEISPEQQANTVASLPLSEGHLIEPFGALLVAERQNQMVASIWAQPQPGNTALLWPPQFLTAFDIELADQLIARAVEESRKTDASFLQAIVEPNDPLIAQQLTGAGFIHAADLDYLEWLPRSLEFASIRTLLFEQFHESKLERLKEILEKTYIDSFDCPQFDAMRTLDDVLAGYRATGDSDTQLWMIAMENGVDVGVLLLADFPKSQQLELIYMGVVPEARNRGVGSALLQRAQAISMERRTKKILLAVDAANTPARRLYDRAGFKPWLKRSLFFRAYPGHS